MDDDLIPRRTQATALESVGAFRATVIQGARQVGKSTMASQLGDHIGARTITLDRERTFRRRSMTPPPS